MKTGFLPWRLFHPPLPFLIRTVFPGGFCAGSIRTGDSLRLLFIRIIRAAGILFPSIWLRAGRLSRLILIRRTGRRKLFRIRIVFLLVPLLIPADSCPGQVVLHRSVNTAEERQASVDECAKMARKSRDAFSLFFVTKIRFIRIEIRIIRSAVRILVILSGKPAFRGTPLPFQFKILLFYKSALELGLCVIPVQIQVIRVLTVFIRIRKMGILCKDRFIQIRGKSGLRLPLGFFHRFFRGSFRLEAPRFLLRPDPFRFLGLPS